MKVIKFNSSTDIISKHKPIFDRIANKNTIDNFVLSGGRSSFKSYSCCLAIVIDCILRQAQNKKVNYAVFMNKMEDIRDGVKQQFVNVLDDLDMIDNVRIMQSPHKIIFKNGSCIYFYGLNGQDGKKANAIDNISIIWFEELDQFQSGESILKTLDSLERNSIKGERIVYLYSYNPPRSTHHWVFNFLKKISNQMPIHSTYLDDDTGKNLLPQQLIERIEETKKRDYSWYSWNYLGIVPSNVEIDFPAPVYLDEEITLNEYDYIFAGIDSATKGKDSTCLCLMSYNTKIKKIKMIGFQKFDDEWVDGYTSYVVSENISNFLKSVNCNGVYIDSAYGQHIIDYLIQNVPEVTCKPINFGGKKSDRVKGKTSLALNKRAEMYINLSNELQSKNIIFYNYYQELERELEATELEIDSKTIKVVSKELIKSRIGHSPDELDSMVLCLQAIYDIMRL